MQDQWIYPNLIIHLNYFVQKYKKQYPNHDKIIPICIQ